jgi:hypothetical protein
MSLLQKLADYLRRRPGESLVHVVAAQSQPLELSLSPDAGTPQESRIIEGDGLEFHRVRSDGVSGFTHFLDGIQQSTVVMYMGDAVPVVYGYAAAVIRMRGDDRTMSTYSEASCERLFFPFKLAPEEQIEAFKEAGIECEDSGIPHDKDKQTISGIYQQCLNTVRSMRSHLERELLSQWQDQFRDDPSAWLLVDGGLRDITRITEAAGNIVGLVKDCRTPFFAWAQQAKVFNMPAGYRCSIFETPPAQTNPVHSWYQRLWDNKGRDMLFGLVRVEVPASRHSLSLVEKLSGWIFAERGPLSHPDPRWDRLVYPIHDCEMYLKSTAPSISFVHAILGSVGG